MDRIQTSTKFVDKFGAGKPGFTAGNPATGIPATQLSETFFDSLQEEVCAVIEGQGIALAVGDRTQLRQAIQKMLTAAQKAVVIDQAVFAVGVVTGNAVYWDAANSRFDQALADGTVKQNAVGFADVTNGKVYAFGSAVLFAGLTPGAYYLSGTTAGAITTTAPANPLFVGIAKSATEMFVDIDAVGFITQAQADARYTPIAYTQRFAEVTANITLSAASSGGFMHITGGIATLPAPADGLRYMIIGKGSGGSVAAPAGSSLVLPDGTSMAAGSLTIAAGTAIEVVARADDTTWTVYNTSGQLITRPGTANNHAVNLGQFASSLAASGYKKYPDINSPSGFCIEQWGTFSLAAAAGSTQAITFPIAFPNGLLYPDVSVESAATDMIGTTGRSLTGMTISKGGNDATARTGFWRVLGY